MTPTLATELHTSKALRSLRTIRLAIVTIPTLPAISETKIIRQPLKHKLITAVQGLVIALSIERDDAIAINPVPQLEIAPRLVNNAGILGLADCEVLFDEPVPPHHHVDGAAEAAQEVGDGRVAGRAGHGHVEGPEDFAGAVEGFHALFVGHVGEGVVRFALGPVLEVRHGVVHGVADLAEDVVLFVRVPGVQQVVAGERRGDGEAGEGVAVPHTEPLARRADEGIDVPTEQLAVVSAVAGLVGCDEEESLVFAGHVCVARGAVEDAVEDAVQVVAEDFGAGSDVDHGATELGDDADDDDAHERDVAAPIRVLGDHGARVFPGAGQNLALDLGGQIEVVEVMGDVIGVVPLVLDGHCRWCPGRSDVYLGVWGQCRPAQTEILSSNIKQCTTCMMREL